MELASDCSAHQLTFGERIVYAGGEVAASLAWNVVNGYLLFYYSNVVFLPLAALGTLMLVARVFDAAVDPLVGLLVDRTRTRWGQARPYLLFGSVPFGIVCVLTFSVPNFSVTGKIIYAYATFTTLGLLYSLIYVPYGAMQPMLTRNPADKIRLSGYRAMATSIASIIAFGTINWFVGLPGPDKPAQGFLLASAVFAAASVALFLLVGLVCRERLHTIGARSSTSIGHDVRNLLRNPAWLFVCAYAMITFVRLGSMISVTAYFVVDVLRRPAMMAVLLPLVSVAILIGGFISTFVNRRFGQRNANIWVLAISIVCYFAMAAMRQQTTLLVVLFMLANIPGGVIAASLYATVTDAVEVQEKRFHSTSPGLVYSSVSFSMKVGMACGAALTAYVLAWAKYDPHAVTPGAEKAINALFFYAPIMLAGLQLLCVLSYRNTSLSAAKS